MSYRIKLTDIFVQNSKFQVSHSSQDYYTACSPTDYYKSYFIVKVTLLVRVCELFFT